MISKRLRRGAAIALSAMAAFQFAEASGAHAAGQQYVRAEAMCRPAAANAATCFGMRIVRSHQGAPGARVRPATDGRPAGPNGGYTPGNLAAAYHVDPSTPTTQVVGVVDAFNNPKVLTDLNRFDAQYGLPAETAASFAKVSQTGSTTTFPRTDTGWAQEISLDVQAVRGLCHACRIVLVEANSAKFADLAVAEDQAVAQGATIVSNSYGGAEGRSVPASVRQAYTHPGVVILASTGDHGMYDWDITNGGSDVSSEAPSLPASFDSVVAVGGTTLYLNDDGTRSGETVWNENGPADVAGNNLFSALGATGGGCSKLITAPAWQRQTPGWAQTTCGTKRLPADVSALADPYTGFDIYDSYNFGWGTIGGTSLSTPIIAALWALAGGSGGVDYPAATLYQHLATDASTSLNDITTGGNGLCGGMPAQLCEQSFGVPPNDFGRGTVDCAWKPNSSRRSAGTRACNAATGYDGPSGVGTPNGLTAFQPINPSSTGNIASASAVPLRR